MSLRTIAAVLSLALPTGCAAAPYVRAPAGEAFVTARLGSTTRTEAVRITPVELVEDSRCPADAMCVQQGTARVRAAIEVGGVSRTEVLTLGRKVRVGDRCIGLAGACPYPLASQPAAPADRRFVFSVSETDTPPPEGRDFCG